MKNIDLPSGKKLRMDLATFSDARDLYQSVLKECKDLKIKGADDIDINLFKDIFCTLLSSKDIEEKTWTCMSRVVYDDAKITKDSFEGEKEREDYIIICYEIAWYNIAPFMKGPYAKLSPLLEGLEKIKNLI